MPDLSDGPSQDVLKKLDKLFDAYDEFLMRKIDSIELWRGHLFEILQYFNEEATLLGLSGIDQQDIQVLLTQIPSILASYIKARGVDKVSDMRFEISLGHYYDTAIKISKNLYPIVEPMYREPSLSQGISPTTPSKERQPSSIVEVMRGLNAVTRDADSLKALIDELLLNRENQPTLAFIARSGIVATRQLRYDCETLIHNIEPDFPLAWHENVRSIYEKLSAHFEKLLQCLHKVNEGINTVPPIILTIQKQIEVLSDVTLAKIDDKKVDSAVTVRMDDPNTKNQNQVVDVIDFKKYYKNSHAIVIGISRYKEEIELPNAYNDANSIKKVLEMKYGFDVMISLFNQDATADRIREIFVDLLPDENLIGSKDRLIIYYSGHGKLRKSIGYEGQGVKEGYIVPYDSKLNKYSSNISMETIVKGCQNCVAKHVLLILDCCYSGAAFTRSGSEPDRPKNVTDAYIKDITSRRAIQVLAAGQEDEPVSDSGKRPGYSAFTGALLDILQPESDPDNNGILTASEIGTYLEQQVSLQEGRRYQRPAYNRISGSDNGDLIFKIFNISKPEVG